MFLIVARPVGWRRLPKGDVVTPNTWRGRRRRGLLEKKAYASLSHGWALGTDGFKQALIKDHALVAEARATEAAHGTNRAASHLHAAYPSKAFTKIGFINLLDLLKSAQAKPSVRNRRMREPHVRWCESWGRAISPGYSMRKQIVYLLTSCPAIRRRARPPHRHDATTR